MPTETTSTIALSVSEPGEGFPIFPLFSYASLQSLSSLLTLTRVGPFKDILGRKYVIRY